MLFMLRLIAIAAFLFAANLNLFAQQDTSGWVQEGNALFQRMQVDSITQFGLSVSGDTVWTYSKNNVLRFWKVEDGKLIFEKSFARAYEISSDLKTYFKIDKELIYNIRFEVYDMKTDSLIKHSKGNFLGGDAIIEIHRMLADYDFYREQIYLAYSISGVVFPNSFFTRSDLSVFKFDGFDKLNLVHNYSFDNVDLIFNDSRTEILAEDSYEYEDKKKVEFQLLIWM
ncbi:MAG: hypothetical protein KGZ71_08595 [Desulfobulbaceae bacterium]|nr:hypothetical protein [Desulfobulbaceae bacterium]